MQDGFVDRYFNRKLSGPLTQVFMKTPLTPNQITLIAFGVGLGSAFCFLIGEYYYGILGAVLFQLSAVLDCCDGEVARLKSMQSRFGWWLDLITDNIVHGAIFLAIAWASYQQTGQAWRFAPGVAASVGIFLSLCFVILRERQIAVYPIPKGFSDALGRLIDRMTNRDFSLAILFFALIGHLEWFVWMAALGANIFWMLLWRLYRQQVYAS